MIIGEKCDGGQHRKSIGERWEVGTVGRENFSNE